MPNYKIIAVETNSPVLSLNYVKMTTSIQAKLVKLSRQHVIQLGSLCPGSRQKLKPWIDFEGKLIDPFHPSPYTN